MLLTRVVVLTYAFRPCVGFSSFPLFLHIPGSVRRLRLAPPHPTRLVRSPLVYLSRRRIFFLWHRRCFTRQFPHPSRHFHDWSCDIGDFKRISWRRRLVVPRPSFLPFTNYNRCSHSKAIAVRIVYFDSGIPWIGVGGLVHA